MKELWKDIPRYEGLYQASNHGRIRRIHKDKRSSPFKILKLYQRPDGHMEAGLNKNNKKRNYLVHRLILSTFISQCPPNMECRHLDGNPQNNILMNLRWGSRSENVQDAIRHGTRYTGDHKGTKHGMAKLTNQHVLDIRKLLINGESGVILAKKFNVTPAEISRIKLRQTWTHI